MVVGFKANPKGCIWEPWGGELTKNHNWTVLDPYAPSIAYAQSMTTDPIQKYHLETLTHRYQNWVYHHWGVRWGETPLHLWFVDPEDFPITPEDIPFAGITTSNCKVVIDIQSLSEFRGDGYPNVGVSFSLAQRGGTTGVGFTLPASVVTPTKVEYIVSEHPQAIPDAPIDGIGFEVDVWTVANYPYTTLDFEINSIDFVEI